MSTSVGAARAHVKSLAEQRGVVETELLSCLARLEADGQPGLHGSLLDSEGFPRADVDIHTIRRDRHRVAILKTDYVELTKALDEGLTRLHALARADGSAELNSWLPAPQAEPPKRPRVEPLSHPPSPSPMDVEPVAVVESQVPWAVVDEVVGGSPAAEAGLALGDCLLAVGSAQTLAATPEVVRAAAESGATLTVHLLRRGQAMALRLSPRVWEGRGVLGCHLTPARG